MNFEVRDAVRSWDETVREAIVDGNKASLRRLESEQLISVVFVLFLPGSYFSGQAAGEIVAQGLEAVQDGDNAALFFQGRNGNFKVFYARNMYMRYASTLFSCIKLFLYICQYVI